MPASGRKVILFMHYSLDGAVGRPNEPRMPWITPDTDLEMGRHLIPDLLKTVDTMLLGRELFQGFEQAWPAMVKAPGMPKEMVEMGQWIEDSPKHVFSKTLTKAGWKNAHVHRVTTDQDIAKKVNVLKQEEGGDMVVFGGARFAQTLTRLGLVDEYRLKLEPVVLGPDAYHLFDGTRDARLHLTHQKAFKSGVQGLYYKPKA
jgi:dihydrofolate reductase